MAKRKRRKQDPGGPSMEALVGVAAAGTFGYLAVESIMNDGQHPIHWLVTLVVAGIGYGVGQGVYWWKNEHR